mmetsp:Transcript_15291/g.19687  ORF Transcript_15291/g.19687 Transcript_15291/m.19687 type:complete len:97 (+) Transcript_15291:111-401(+)
MQMHGEIQVVPEVQQRITVNANKRKASLQEIVFPDTNLQSYDEFRESLFAINTTTYKVLMKNPATTNKSKFHIAEQFKQITRKLSQCYCSENVKPK